MLLERGTGDQHVLLECVGMEDSVRFLAGLTYIEACYMSRVVRFVN